VEGCRGSHTAPIDHWRALLALAASPDHLFAPAEGEMRALIKRLLYRLGYEVTRVPSRQVEASATDSDPVRLSLVVGQAEVLKLHFGCGPRVLKGWVNIDLAYEPYERYLQYYTDRFYPAPIRGGREDFFAIDITRAGLPLPDNCVDVVFHEDFLEHLDQKDQVLFLAETHRVLKPGAVHRVNTPNLIESMQRQSDFSKGVAGVYAGEWTDHGHRNVLSRGSLAELALMVGYSDIAFTGRDQSRSGLVPAEYRPDPADRPETGNIFADLIA
jgi:hypothetical protein